MKSEHDIIKQMADRLREHSVPYKEGAWERFKEMEKKRSKFIVLWPYLSAAAVILIAIFLFLNPVEHTVVSTELAEQNIKKENKKEKNVKAFEGPSFRATTMDKELVPKINSIKQNGSTLASEANISKEKLRNNGIQDGMDVNLTMVEGTTASHNEDKEISKESMVKVSNAEPSLISSVKRKKVPGDFLTALSAIKEDASIHESKGMIKQWSVGLDVSPNIGSNQHVNIGGGVSFAYSVSSKVSISSGISYLQVGTERIPGFTPLSSPSVFSPIIAGPFLDISSPGVAYPGGRSQTKTLHKIEASVVGLDIPFSINYHVNKRLFASAGISIFNVLNEGRMSQFENRVVDVVYRSVESKTPEPVVHTFFTKEVISEKNYEGRNLNGFINFSVGYSIPVSEKVGFSIEPFFKIQMGSLIEEDLNLSNGGIKISTSF